MSRTPARDLRRIAAEMNARREGELRSKEFQFRAFAARRLSLTGVRYLLLLHVWPDSGFDNFEWEAYRRSWVGNIRAVDDVSSRANAVLDAYAERDTPPGPAFQ